MKENLEDNLVGALDYASYSFDILISSLFFALIAVFVFGTLDKFKGKMNINLFILICFVITGVIEFALYHLLITV